MKISSKIELSIQEGSFVEIELLRSFSRFLLTKTEETVFGSSNKVLSSKSELLGSLSRSSSYNSEMTIFVAESPSNEAISLNPIALILQECLLSH